MTDAGDKDGKLSLHQALLKAQQHIIKIEKDATNDFHKYSYASSEAMITAAREALHVAGLLTLRTHWELEMGDNIGKLTSHMQVIHPDSGQTLEEVIPWPIIPAQGRPFDKAVASALTTSQSYWLRDLLQIPRTDPEIEMDKRDDRDYRPPKARPSAPPVQPAAETVKYVSPSTVLSITTSLKAAGLSVEKFCAGMNIPTIDRLPTSRLDEAAKRIADYVEAKKASEPTEKPEEDNE